MRTLCIDIGGSGIKAIVVDVEGVAQTERGRIETPRPAVPEAVLTVIEDLARQQGEFDRVSAGFPGVVVEGVTRTAPNLHPTWADFPLARTIEERVRRPARVANDAGVQGLGVVEGKGVEVVITLGTGMGFGLYVEGRYVPNIEMAHHPFEKGKTYEDRVGNAARKKAGNKRWNRRVRDVIGTLGPIFNYRKLYVGGGNAKHLDRAGLPGNVAIVDNVAGLLGGVRLWG
ncbi:MAG: ROK family protein [Polyangiaceae bacterium]